MVSVSLPIDAGFRVPLPRWSAPASFNNRRTFASIALTLGLALILNVSGVSGAPPACVEDGSFDATSDYFDDKVIPADGGGWRVTYHGSFKVLTNELAGKSYVLTLCGTPAPSQDDEAVPEGALYFTIPLEEVAVEETTTMNFLEILGVRGALKFLDTTYVTSPCLNRLAMTGKVEQFEGPEAYGGDATVRAAQFEASDAHLGGWNDLDDPKTIQISAPLAPGMLHRGEWIKMLSTLFNREAEANTHFEAVEERYNCHKEAAQQAATVHGSPLVAWIDAGWGITVSTADYKMQVTEDAGATPWMPEKTSFDSALELAQAMAEAGVDIVIDETYNLADWDAMLEKHEWTGNPEIEALDLPFLKTGMVARNDRLAKISKDVTASDWLESSLSEPDVVLEDLITITQPSLAAVAPHDRYWFRLPAQGEGIVAIVQFCTDPDAPLTIKADSCPHDATTAPGKPTTTTAAPSTGSASLCEGKCGTDQAQGPVSSHCYCDTGCAQYGDCCPGYADVCNDGSAAVPSGCAELLKVIEAMCPASATGFIGVSLCADNCGKEVKSASCFCDPQCMSLGDCCAGYEAACGVFGATEPHPMCPELHQTAGVVCPNSA